MSAITTRFDFSGAIARSGSGQTHTSTVAANNQIKPTMLNEYERILCLATSVIGDYSLSTSIPGASNNIGSGIRKVYENILTVDYEVTELGSKHITITPDEQTGDIPYVCTTIETDYSEDGDLVLTLSSNRDVTTIALDPLSIGSMDSASLINMGCADECTIFGVDDTLVCIDGVNDRIGTAIVSLSGLISGSESTSSLHSTFQVGSGETTWAVDRTTNDYYSAGDIGPAGGYIFKVDSLGGGVYQYYECASEDYHLSTMWSHIFDDLLGETSTDLGSGEVNSSGMVNSSGLIYTAATSCSNHVEGGYNDWFLPSKDELNEIYTALHLQGLGSFSNVIYWSSSESASTTAWAQNFDGGSQGELVKYVFAYIRPCRTFRTGSVNLLANCYPDNSVYNRYNLYNSGCNGISIEMHPWSDTSKTDISFGFIDKDTGIRSVSASIAMNGVTEMSGIIHMSGEGGEITIEGDATSFENEYLISGITPSDWDDDTIYFMWKG